MEKIFVKITYTLKVYPGTSDIPQKIEQFKELIPHRVFLNVIKPFCDCPITKEANMRLNLKSYHTN